MSTNRGTGPLNQPGAPAKSSEAPFAPTSGRHEEIGRLGEGARTDVFEVFRQEKDGDPMRHAGNVVAPDLELATHYAREMYSRRNESVRLWVVPRTQITDLSDPDLLQPPLDRSFKKPGGYVMRDKLEVAKKRAAGEKAADGRGAGGR
jgi:phenylacetate-CoA oxygenase PaaH subunit